jgi:hypothetical protein
MNQKAQLAELVLVPADVGREVFSTPFLVLEVPSTECMLGMKLARFAGDTDLDDARLLLRDLRPRFSDPEDIWSHVGGLIPAKKREQARHNLDLLWNDQ